ncbi:hypothetical protein C8A00DRAFT_40671 [Chaetomidium leptoderma]|uniref:GRF-type domain-containing protein n=1 Tax=Chaetomidium leptoderma TaxID=669021 RepID=A0AAN6VUS2_9PEZI|nr:hypothetical protein C8A00DRAFT_40671 [Chaetomidium leptoderma]
MSTPTSTPSSQARVKHAPGKFVGGTWFCACDPPGQAVFLQVKKEGATKGKWFYTCPKPRGAQCPFFLWEEGASVLEKKAGEQQPDFSSSLGASDVMDTPQSEAASIFGGPTYSRASSVFPTPAPRQRMFRGIPSGPDPLGSSDEDSDATTTQRSRSRFSQYPGASTPTPKRKRSHVNEDRSTGRGGNREDRGATVDLLSDLDSDGANQLAELADQAEERFHQSQQSQQSRPPPPSSSQRSQFSDTPPSTPTRTTGFGGLPTPETGNSFAAPSFSEPGAKRFKSATTTGGLDPSTPTPARTRNIFTGSVASAPLSGGGGKQSQQPGDWQQHPDATATTADATGTADLTTAILDLLKTQPVSGATRTAVREALALHARRVRGVERARDVLREGQRMRDRRIGMLQARVLALENERRARTVLLKKAASDLEALSQQEDDTGGGVVGGGSFGGGLEE